MCCLRYEHEIYEEAIKHTPPTGSIVKTSDGEGVVIETKPLAKEIKVKFNDGEKDTVKLFKCADVKIISRPNKHKDKEKDEEEIFEDHCLSIKGLNPDKLIIMPGRVSTEVSEEYYNQIKDEFNSEYCPVEFDFEKRINKVLDLIQNSQYNYIIISGCGEEIIFWDELKKKIRELNS
jgi:hypothetical protein